MYSNIVNYLRRGFENLASLLSEESLPDSPDAEENASQEQPAVVEEAVSAKIVEEEEAVPSRKKPSQPVCTDPFLRFLISNQAFKNWLKVNVALRVVCEYISPTLQDAVKNMHSKLLAKHGKAEITLDDIEQYKKLPETSDKLFHWMKDVVEQHRHVNMPGLEILQACNPQKWAKEDGAWEVAKAYMREGQKAGEDEAKNVSNFNISSLVDFMMNCKEIGAHVNIQLVERVLQVWNSISRSARFQIDEKELEDHLSNLQKFFYDKQFLNIADKGLRTKCLQTFEKIKMSDFELLALDKVKATAVRTPNPSGNTMLDTLAQVLSEVEMSVEHFLEIQQHILDREINTTTSKSKQTINDEDSDTSYSLGNSPTSSNHSSISDDISLTELLNESKKRKMLASQQSDDISSKRKKDEKEEQNILPKNNKKNTDNGKVRRP